MGLIAPVIPQSAWEGCPTHLLYMTPQAQIAGLKGSIRAALVQQVQLCNPHLTFAVQPSPDLAPTNSAHLRALNLPVCVCVRLRVCRFPAADGCTPVRCHFLCACVYAGTCSRQTQICSALVGMRMRMRRTAKRRRRATARRRGLRPKERCDCPHLF